MVTSMWRCGGRCGTLCALLAIVFSATGWAQGTEAAIEGVPSLSGVSETDPAEQSPGLPRGFGRQSYGPASSPNSQDLTAYRGTRHRSKVVEITGTIGGSVWGTDIYTDDSNVAAAAVHAGVLANGERGRVRIVFLPGQNVYVGSTRRGVTSSGYHAWNGSYRLERVGGAMDPAPSAESASQYRGRNGERFTIHGVTGKLSGSVWGSKIYTDDSDIGTAAVHAGVLQPGETSDVEILILPGRSQYSASSEHDVTSYEYGAWKGSFKFTGERTIVESPRPLHSLPPRSEWSKHIGDSFELEVVGTREGTVWGTTVYTSDSPLGAAAVHAGVLSPGERGKVRITILPGRSSYVGTSRHGISSRPYGAWEGSYFIEKALPASAADEILDGLHELIEPDAPGLAPPVP